MSKVLTRPADRIAVAAFAESDDRYRAVFNGVSDAILISNPITGKFLDINRSGCEMFGYEKDELIGRGVEALSSGIHPYTREYAIERCQQAYFDKPQTFEWQCMTKNGSVFWTEVSLRSSVFGTTPAILANVRDITERKRLDAQISHMANHDALTGLANRSAFTATLRRAMQHARRGAPSLAILFLDLDHFKDVNALHGHVVGDQLVRLVAERLQGAVRYSETVFRLGGDGFAILLGEAGEPADIGAVAERLIAAISDAFVVDGREMQVEASIGVAIAGDSASDPVALMSQAESALYRAKAEGRQTWRFYSDAMDADVRSRIAMTSELRFAIPAGELFVVYQPQVKASDGRITGVEALVRWAHPERGVLYPASFLPVAESSGLIVALDRWVLREACRQARRWIDAGFAPMTMCVNLASAQFRQPLDLERRVLAALEETALPPAMLELEITERTFIGFSSEHRHMIQRLRSAGVRFALDDFGTGFSSLNYLRRFGVDRIKIAREFIADLGTCSDAAAIVKCILTLARDLGNEVIAEGVETPEQLKLLQGWDCPDIQGFYFAAPMPAETVSPLLSAGAIVRPN